MKRYSFTLIMILLAVQGLMAGSKSDEKAVQDAAAGFYRALNEMFMGDLTSMKQVWSHAEDVTYMGPTGGMQVGWNQALANWESQAALKMGGKVWPEEMKISVGRDIAITSNYEKGENLTVDGKKQTVSIRATNVFRKENGQWKMIAHHTDVLPFLAK